jgi:ABC-type multidrug transport system permease subunit
MAMAQYLFAGLVAYTAAVAGFVDMPEGVVGARSAGVLKRLRGTPLPFRWYFAGRVSAALITALLGGVVLAVVGVGFLGVRLDAARLPAALLAVGAGTLCFAALGLAVAALLAKARSLVAVTLGTLLPLCFISEVFVVGDRPLPAGLTAIADVFPLRHLLQAVLTATGPAGTGAGIAWQHLAVLAGWAAVALLVAQAQRFCPWWSRVARDRCLTRRCLSMAELDRPRPLPDTATSALAARPGRGTGPGPSTCREGTPRPAHGDRSTRR